MNHPYFASHIFTLAEKYGDKTVLCARPNAGMPWVTLSWKQFSQQIHKLSRALITHGVKSLDRVAQFSQNKAENLVIDFALYGVRGIVVPIYATSTAEQLDYIVKDAHIELIFVGDQKQYDIADIVMSSNAILRKIVVLDPTVDINNNPQAFYYQDFIGSEPQEDHSEVLAHRRQESSTEDIACIMYTSGTTGNPKGVMLNHSCFDEAMRIHAQRLHTVSSHDNSLAFLPLSHVFERMWCYFCLTQGVTIYINQFPTEIQQTIRELRPSLMCSVPRFWEKVYEGVQETISGYSPLLQGIVTWALATGRIYNLNYKREDKKAGFGLRMKYLIADKLVFSQVKNKLGIENARMLPTAGARLANEIAEFFLSIGLPIVYGYGLTESSATVSCFDYTHFRIGTVGTIMPDLQVRIGEDNEIQLKGKTIFSGYYNNPIATKEAFTEDGWFRTGDAGHLIDNHIVLTERLKDLFKTSNGKYIAPQEIETRLIVDKYIEQAAVIGDERNYVTAILYPNISAIRKYALEKNISITTTETLLNHPQIQSLIKDRIRLRQEGMASFEQIKKFTLISKGFTIETGELTNTLKIRRTVIQHKYKELIDNMYAI